MSGIPIDELPGLRYESGDDLNTVPWFRYVGTDPGTLPSLQVTIKTNLLAELAKVLGTLGTDLHTFAKF